MMGTTTLVVRDHNGNTLHRAEIELESARILGARAVRFDNGAGVVLEILTDEGTDELEPSLD